MAKTTCEHKGCSCTVDPGKRFCSDACRDLAQTSSSMSQTRCGCDHPECAGQAAPQQ